MTNSFSKNPKLILFVVLVAFATALVAFVGFGTYFTTHASAIGDDSNVKKLFTPRFVAKETYVSTDIVKLTDEKNNYYYTDNKSFVIKGGELLNKVTVDPIVEVERGQEPSIKDVLKGDELPIEKIKKRSPSGVDDVIGATNLSEVYKSKLAAVIKEKPLPSKISSPAQSSTNKTALSNMSQQTNLNATDKSCYINFGGFDQPKIAYSDTCSKLSASDKQKKIKTMMENFPEEYFIKYKAENETAEIYVFTDYTCGYCQRLHAKVDEFLERGVSVNYILYPRGIGSNSYIEQTKEVVKNMNSAWCSDDQLAALNNLYKNRSLPNTECKKEDHKLDSPVRQYYILGMMFEIEATPLIIASNGNTAYGFKRVSTVLSELGIK